LAAPAAEREEKMKLNQLKGMREFIREEDGMGTVEIILIIVVLVGLVIIFKGQIIQIINSLFQKITSQTGTV
jgi:Flp pilus assembly pilin Flp